MGGARCRAEPAPGRVGVDLGTAGSIATERVAHVGLAIEPLPLA
ncbi:hypothetical protein [Agromyces soli]|nr:hypothetical protein [Agromyces soli]